MKYRAMRWKKLKKVIISLLIIKIIIFVFFIFKSDLVSFSRDINYSGNYQQGTETDTTGKKQKFIRIVRNEEERGITIKIRGKKNARPLRDSQREKYVPIVE